MDAKKCDRCGKFFCENDYAGSKIPRVKAFGPNGEEVPVNWIGRGDRRWLDMCRKCKEEFVIWWKEAQSSADKRGET